MEFSRRKLAKEAAADLRNIPLHTLVPFEPVFAPFVDSHFGVDFGATAALHDGEKTQADLLIDGTNTKLPAGSFDTLLSTQVLEHVFETDAFIAECHRLLAAGGKGIFTIPFV